MEISIDTDELVEAVAEGVKELLQEEIESMVRLGFDYHDDHFRLSWARCSETELNDLEHSTKDGACNHGQFAYRAVFQVIKQFLGHYTREQIMDMIGTMIYDEEEISQDVDEEVVMQVARPTASPVTMTWDVTARILPGE